MTTTQATAKRDELMENYQQMLAGLINREITRQVNKLATHIDIIITSKELWDFMDNKLGLPGADVWNELIEPIVIDLKNKGYCCWSSENSLKITYEF